MDMNFSFKNNILVPRPSACSALQNVVGSFCLSHSLQRAVQRKDAGHSLSSANLPKRRIEVVSMFFSIIPL